ncbi:DUF1971 domain-containing protein (plasmid) [Polymorphobacter megasporae]|nr:DUF1971 domain-containing protein [Polymorphobacter sp. PAMC 29334]UAJ12956.1 DUF1971 domain-containing protein [Polymorphobacter megasporae]
MPCIPLGFAPTRRTPDFTEATLPEKLRGPHSTAKGAWALIHVVEGKLLYRVLDRDAQSEVLLSRETTPGVIVPEQLHCVEPQGPVAFYVEFYRADGAAATPHSNQSNASSAGVI